MGTGLVSRAEFERQVERFVDISNGINDEWRLVRSNTGILYMVKKCLVIPTERLAAADVSSFPSSYASHNITKTTEASKLTSIATLPSELSPPTAFPAATRLPEADHHLQLGKHSPLSVSPPNQVLYSAEKEKQDNLLQLESLTSTGTTHVGPSISGNGRRHVLPKSGDQISQQETLKLSLNSDWRTLTTQNNKMIEDTKCPEGNNIEESPQAAACLDSLEMEMESDGEDESCMMPDSYHPHQTPLTYEYHVVYSESYSVPVLYFNIFTPDGKLLPLEEVWKLCPPSYQDHITENKWTTLTQQEHPLLGRPYLQLHPCHTADLMAQVTMGKEHSKTYLATWLSTVGPLIALKIAPAYIF